MKPTYTQNGETKKARTYAVEFRHNGKLHRISFGNRDKRAAEGNRRRLELLRERTESGEALGDELSRWIDGLPTRVRDKLADMGLLAAGRAAASTGLLDHVDAWAKSIEDKGRTERHVRTTKNRVRKALEALNATQWSDVDPGKVQAYLRKLGESRSSQTVKHALVSLRQFAKWFSTRYLLPNPMLAVEPPRVEPTFERRALNEKEVGKLLEKVREGASCGGMDAKSREVLYSLALSTGLRANELRCLQIGDLDLMGEIPTVTVRAMNSKRRKKDELALGAGLLPLLSAYTKGKKADELVFPEMPDQYNTARMLKADLVAAGVKYETKAGRADFHALRHTYVTNVERIAGISRETLEASRHSDPSLTLRYAHGRLEEQQKLMDSIVASLIAG